MVKEIKHCPFCGSHDLEKFTVEKFNEPTIWIEVSSFVCVSCYELFGIITDQGAFFSVEDLLQEGELSEDGQEQP